MLRLVWLLGTTGCGVLCSGDERSVATTKWEGTDIFEPRVSAAGDAQLVIWRSGVEHALVGGTRLDFSSATSTTAPQIASSPNGHVLIGHGPLTPDGYQPAVALSLTAAGELSGPFETLAPRTAGNTLAVFDGARFQLAWGEPTLGIATLEPGTQTYSDPVTTGLQPGAHLSMASDGGATWVTWLREGRIEGVRVAGTTTLDAAPRVIASESAMLTNSQLAIAAGGGTFLAVIGGADETTRMPIAIPFDASGAAGAAQRLPLPYDDEQLSLAAEPGGFVLLIGDQLAHLDPTGAMRSVETLPESYAASVGGSPPRLVRMVDRRPGSRTREEVLMVRDLATGREIELVVSPFELVDTHECVSNEYY